MIANVMASPTESGESESSPTTRARIMRVRVRLGLDWPRLVARGGGGTLGLIAVAFVGLYLPGPVRFGLLAVGFLASRLLQEGTPRLAAQLPIVWLALAWGLGLLQPLVGIALLVVISAEAGLWWRWQETLAAVEPEEAEEATRPLTPDERLNALLADAPVEGLPFAEIVALMAPHMSRSTVHERLRQRGWKISPGRWRARPAGVHEP